MAGDKLPGKQQQGVLAESVAALGRAVAGQIVAGGIEPHLYGGEALDHQLVVVRAQPADGEIGLPVGDVADADRGLQAEPDAGVALAQQGESGQHEGLSQGVGGGDAHLAAQALIAGARLAFDGLDGLLHGAGIRQHGLAGELRS